MKLYHKFDIADFDTIVEKLKSYLVSEGLVENSKNGYIPLDLVEVKTICPELISVLKDMNFIVLGVAIYKTSAEEILPPVHIDNVPNNAYSSRVNIPIMNCETSSTVFYDADILEARTQDEHIKYIQCVNEVEIDRVTIDKPTILVINKPHQVLMDLTRSPRICLTVRVYPDPITTV